MQAPLFILQKYLDFWPFVTSYSFAYFNGNKMGKKLHFFLKKYTIFISEKFKEQLAKNCTQGCLFNKTVTIYISYFS